MVTHRKHRRKQYGGEDDAKKVDNPGLTLEQIKGKKFENKQVAAASGLGIAASAAALTMLLLGGKTRKKKIRKTKTNAKTKTKNRNKKQSRPLRKTKKINK